MRRLLSCVIALCATTFFASCAATDRTAVRTSQTRAVWVFFKTDAARSNAPAAISSYALQERHKHGIGTFDNDAPIPQALVKQIEKTGAHVREQSRWLRAVSVDADPAALRRIQKLDVVARIHSVGQLVKMDAGEARASTNALIEATATAAHNTDRAPFDSAYYGPNWSGIRPLGVHQANAVGFDGTGVRIAIFDTGFERQHEALRTRTVIAQRDFINHDNNVSDEPGETASGLPEEHGTRVWSIIGGLSPTLIVGPAPEAQFILAKIDQEPGDHVADEDRWVAAMEWADSLHANIINSSVALRYFFDPERPPLPYDSLNGDSFVITRAADEAARRNILVITAMGDAPTNEAGTLMAPADADSVISVGSVDRFGNPATFGQGFTARGPTSDGRIKPELVALGTNMVGAASVPQVGVTPGLAGTSYSTALMTGAVALFLQAYPDKRPMEVRRALQLAGNAATHPGNILGWGIPDVAAAIMFPQGITLNTIDPIDLTGAVTSIAPTFSWFAPETNTAMRPILYRVQVATDTGFTNIVFTDTVREGSSITTRTALPPAQRIFWRVVATGTAGVTRASPTTQFRVPDWVKLLTFNGAQPTFSTTTQPELSWIPLEPRGAGPFTYEVQILANGTGAVVQSIRNLTASTVRVLAPLTPNQSYRWRVIARAKTGQVDTVQTVQPFVIATDDKPPTTILYQNFPNPFPNLSTATDGTAIWFDLAQDGPVSLRVATTRGITVKQLIPAKGCSTVTLPAGIYGRPGQDTGDACIITRWDGRADDGRTVAGGIYILELRAGGVLLSKKILFAPGK